MIEQLDRRILALETELEELRRRKIAMLQQQIAEVQASISGATSGSSSKTGSPRAGKGWAASMPASGGWTPNPRRGKAGPKKRGRRPGKRVPDEEILPSITRLVRESGGEGISARKVSEAIGVFYPRVAKIMEGNFKKTGERKWSRYHLK